MSKAMTFDQYWNRYVAEDGLDVWNMSDETFTWHRKEAKRLYAMMKKQEGWKMTTYRLIDYFDVYEEEEGCWSVNDLCVIDENVELPNDITDSALVQYLYNRNLVEFNDPDLYAIEGDGDFYIEVFQAEQMIPMYRLERVDVKQEKPVMAETWEV